MRIRHCGFLANRCRATKLALIRDAIGQAQAQAQETAAEPATAEHYRCPRCRQGRLQVVAHPHAPAAADPMPWPSAGA